MTKEAALIKIKSLVERFEEQKEFYKRSEYNETQTRRDSYNEDRINEVVYALYGIGGKKRGK